MICIGFVFYAFAGALVCTLNVRAERIRGLPGIDYPNYQTMPKTSFKCSEQKYIPGFYADLETDCQGFHFCFKHRSESFLCPPGTTFNQPILACDSWFSSNCSLAPLYYIVNAGPGIEDAGKNIPLLLKLRDGAPASTSTLETTRVFDKIASLYEEGSEQEILSAAAEKMASETAEIENSSPKHPDEPKVDPDEVIAESDLNAASISPSEGNEALEDELPSAGHVENKDIQDDSDDKGNEFENLSNLQQDDADLVYDPVTDGYYMVENMQSDAEWQDEPDEQNDQFQNFYGYDSYYNQMMQDEGSEQFQNQYAEEQLSDENTYRAVQGEGLSEDFGIDRSQSNLDEMSQFSKRLLQTVKLPRRTRPGYVIVDQNPGFGYPSRLGAATYPDEESERHLETISMDALVELNTELPDEYSLDGSENYEEFKETESEQNMDENAALDESESNLPSDLESISESGHEAVNYDEQEHMRMLYETGQYQNRQPSFEEPPEEGNFQGVDPYVYSDLESIQDEYQKQDESDDISEPDASDSLDENGDIYSNEQIIVYDDSDDPKIPSNLDGRNFEPEVSEEEESFVIPDETDPSPPEDAVSYLSPDGEYESVNVAGNPNLEYTYSETSQTPANEDPDENIYVYDNVANEQGSEDLQSDKTPDQIYYSEVDEGGYYETRGVPEEMKQNQYADSGQPREIDYSRFQASEYDLDSDPETNKYDPGTYYRYVSETGELLPQYENPDIYQTPHGSVPEDSNISELESYSGPENKFQYGVYGESSAYDSSQPDIQHASYVNDYANYPEFHYYQSPDGIFGLYSNEGDEIQNEPMLRDGVDSAAVTYSVSDISYQVYPEEQADSWNHFRHDTEESDVRDEEGSEANHSLMTDETEANNVTGSTDALSMHGKEDAEDIDGSEIGLVEDFTNRDSDTFYVIDEEGETVDPTYENLEEYRESPNSNSDDVDVLADDMAPNMDKELKFEHGDSNESGSDFVSVTMRGGNEENSDLSATELKTDAGTTFNSRNPEDNWSEQAFGMENEKPVTLSSALERLAAHNPAKVPPKDFVAPTETQFLNSMAFPNSMNFGPYSFGPNAGRQFGMMDSSNAAHFPRTDNSFSDRTDKPSLPNLSKLSSLQEKVRSMKLGKFGMFKKYMNSMKNQN